MASELVKTYDGHLSDDAIEVCDMIDSYIDNSDIEEFSVDVDPNGHVKVGLPDPVGVQFNFAI